MKSDFEFDHIYKTATGRRWFMKSNVSIIGSWSCGYVGLSKGMPHDYDDPFYQQFDFWDGPTFMGVAYPGMVENDVVSIGGSVNNLRNEYQAKAQQLLDEGKAFWVIGHDDFHSERAGDQRMAILTKHIATSMDMFSAIAHEVGKLPWEASK